MKLLYLQLCCINVVKNIFFGSLLLISSQLLAQDCTFDLTGVVKDELGNVLPGATIQVAGKGVVTTTSGEFVIQNICRGDFNLLVSFIGYESYSSQVSLNKNHRITVTLAPSSKLLEVVEVTGDAESNSLTNTSHRISQQELEHFAGKSLGEALKRVPGVSALQTGPAIFKPVIHGLHSQRILILNNGIRQEGQQWGIEHAPEIDPFIASEITVVKGSETVRYGSDAIGGVIIIDTPPLHQTREIGGEINVGAFSNNRMGVISGMVEGGIKKWEHVSWRLQGSAKKGGDFATPDYTLSNTGVEELNFSTAIGYKTETKGVELYASSFNTEIGILRAAHTGNLNDLDNSIRNEVPWYIADFSYQINPPKQKINHHLLKVSAFREIPGIGKLTVLYGGQFNQRKEFDIRRGGRSDKPALSLNLFSNVLDVSLDHSLGGLQGAVGVNATLKNNSNEPGTGVRPLIPNYDQFNTGIFVVEKWRKNKWLLEAGARFDHQQLNVFTFENNQDLIKPSFNFNYVSGSLGASYSFSPLVRVSSNLGLSSRPPHVSELYSEGLHHGTASIEEGLMRKTGEVLTDPNLVKKEVSKKWINRLQFERKKFSFELSAYYNHISNYVFLSPTDTRLTIRGYFPVLQYDQTEAMLLGTDGLIHWDIYKQLEYAGTFAYLYAKDISRNDVLTFIPPAQMNHSFTYHFKTTKLEKFFVTAGIATAFTQTRAPLTVYPTDIPEYTGDKIFDFAPAPNGYTLFNLEVGVRVPVSRHTLSISLQGENITNKTYRVYMNRLRYFADEPGTNVALRMKYDFHSH